MRVTNGKWLIGIVIVAIGLRLLSALYQGNTVADLPGIYDQISYDELARRVIAGYGFSFEEAHWPATRAGEPTAHWSYLYTLYLSGVYWLTGASAVSARVLQAVLAGALHTWLSWRIGNRVFGSAVGIAAAGLTAVYIYFVYYAGALVTETFYIIGVLWTIDCVLRLHRTLTQPSSAPMARNRAWWLWGEFGLAFGITVLLRQVFLLFGPFLFAWLCWAVLRRRNVTREPLRAQVGSLLRGSLLSVLILVFLIIPWTLRNQRVFGTFTPLNTNAGYAFFWGNHPIYGTKFVDILPEDGPSYYDLIPSDLLPLNEAELDRALLKLGLQFVLDDPVRYALLSVSRAQEYFKFWPAPDSGTISNVARVGSFGLVLPFVLYGLWRAGKLTWRASDPYQQASIILLLSFCLIYSGIHLLTWALIRYRLPVDAVLLIFAALGIITLAERVARWRRPVGARAADVALDISGGH